MTAEPDGPELVVMARAVIPARWHPQLDEHIDEVTRLPGSEPLYPGEPALSRCGVFMALHWTLKDVIDARDADGIGSILRFVEDLVGRYPATEPVVGIDDTIANSTFVCFLENLLPVRADQHQLVVPRLGEKTRGLLPEEPWWLDPAPDRPNEID